MRVYRPALPFIIVALLLACGSCKKKDLTEAYRIEKIIYKGETAAGERDLKEIKKRLSKKYKDDRGRSYDDMSDFLSYLFLRGDRFNVFSHVESVTVPGDGPGYIAPIGTRAEAEAKVLMARGKAVKSAADVVPESAGTYRFHLVFEKEEKGDEGWRVVSAEWKPIDFGEFFSD